MKTITNIRKTVATLANRLNKKLKDLSSSFKKAWQIVKGRLLISKVSGVSFGTRQKALKRLAGYQGSDISVSLERETGNQHDTNAVKVFVSVGSGNSYQLGYLPKDLAAILAPLLDKGIQLISHFKSVTGGYYGRETYGALIEIEL